MPTARSVAGPQRGSHAGAAVPAHPARSGHRRRARPLRRAAYIRRAACVKSARRASGPARPWRFVCGCPSVTRQSRHRASASISAGGAQVPCPEGAAQAAVPAAATPFGTSPWRRDRAVRGSYHSICNARAPESGDPSRHPAGGRHGCRRDAVWGSVSNGRCVGRRRACSGQYPPQ